MQQAPEDPYHVQASACCKHCEHPMSSTRPCPRLGSRPCVQARRTSRAPRPACGACAAHARARDDLPVRRIESADVANSMDGTTQKDGEHHDRNHVDSQVSPGSEITVIGPVTRGCERAESLNKRLRGLRGPCVE